MTDFDPTRPPFGRLARLGVVIDATSLDAERIARLIDRAGLGGVWLTERLAGLERPWSTSVWSDAARIAPLLGSATIGVMTVAGPPATGRLYDFELCLLEPAAIDGARRALAADPRRRLRLSAVAEGLAAIRPLFAEVDDIVLPGWAFNDLETAADEARAEAVESGRDPATLGVAVIVPVSIGRTEAEASARADHDPVFAAIGHPRDIGIFGTLEECQDRVIALAHAGVTDLRAILPSSPDVHDVIAQLTAMTVGTTDVLRPGSLRSPAPPPPAGWGGRPERPPSPRVSGGSKRR